MATDERRGGSDGRLSSRPPFAGFTGGCPAGRAPSVCLPEQISSRSGAPAVHLPVHPIVVHTPPSAAQNQRHKASSRAFIRKIAVHAEPAGGGAERALAEGAERLLAQS